MLINWISQNKSFFVYQKSLKRTFKFFFEYKIIFSICVLVLWIHRGYCVVKKLVLNVRINAFWYTKYIFMFLLKIRYNSKISNQFSIQSNRLEFPTLTHKLDLLYFNQKYVIRWIHELTPSLVYLNIVQKLLYPLYY